MEDFKRKEEKLKIIFGTEDKSIDGLTLAAVLIDIEKIIHVIGNEQCKTLGLNFEIDFRIKAFNEHSFEVSSIIAPIISDLVLFQGLNNSIEFVKVLIDIFKLKKIFKDKELPTNIINNGVENNIDVTNGDVKINNYTFNIYNDKDAQKSITDLFGKIDLQKDVENFSLCSDENNTIEFNKPEFEELKQLKENNIEENSISSITGSITSLKSNNPEDNNNHIDIHGLIDNTIIDYATAILNSNEYQKAIEAHKMKKIVKISGELQKLKTKYKFVVVNEFIIL